MTVRRIDALQAERAEIKAFLSEMSPHRVIERVGLQHRLEVLEAEIEQLPPEGKRLDLTFRGEPVEGSRSIVAAFAGRVLATFSDAVATIAASLEHDLGGAGPLPGDKRERCLRVVGPALGSFGFQMEVPPLPLDPQTSVFLEPEASPMEIAVGLTMQLMEAAQAEDEEKLLELIAFEVSPRAAGKVRDFVSTVVSGRATFSLRFNERRTELLDVAAGKRIVDALRLHDMTEETITRFGELWVLPDTRRFELKMLRGVIAGRLSPDLAGVEDFVRKTVNADIKVLRLRSSQPRHTLLAVRYAHSSE